MQFIYFLGAFIFSVQGFSQPLNQGAWISDKYNYVANAVIHQQMTYEFSPTQLKLSIKAQKRAATQLMTDTPEAQTYVFDIARKIWKRKHKSGWLIVKIPAKIHQKNTLHFGVLSFHKEGKSYLRVHLLLNKIYLSVSEAVTQLKKLPTAGGVLLVSQTLYQAQQKLPQIPAITAMSFVQLQQAVHEQLRKASYRKRLKTLKRQGKEIWTDANLQDEVLKKVFLQKGYNPYSSQLMMIDYQLEQMEKRKIIALKQSLATCKNKRNALYAQKKSYLNAARKVKWRAEEKACKLAIKLIGHRLLQVRLQQQWRHINQQKAINKPKVRLLQKQIKQLQEKIQRLVQEQYKALQMPIKFGPVKGE